MRKWTILMLAMLVMVPASASAQVGGRGGVRQMQSRSQLEARVYQRFLEQSGREIGLNSDERSRLRRWLQDSQDQRRNLTDQAEAIRERLLRAVASPETSDAEFEQILGDLNGLRNREHELWQRDQQELAELLPPRKRAQFVIRFLRLQDAVRDLIQQREGGGDVENPVRGGGIDIQETTVEGGNPFAGARRPERVPVPDPIRARGGTGRSPVF